MTLDKRMDDIIESLEKLTEHLKQIKESNDTPQEKVEGFISQIDWAIPNLSRYLLVRQLMRDLKRDKSLETRKFDG